MQAQKVSTPTWHPGGPHLTWPSTPEALAAEQRRLGVLQTDLWTPPDRPLVVAGCFICFDVIAEQEAPRSERAWAAAVLLRGRRPLATSVVEGFTECAYEPGLLALREGQLLAGALLKLGARPDVVMINATGRDHPRRAGLALHIGALLDVATVGVTDRALIATGEALQGDRGTRAPLRVDGDVVAHWVVSRRGARPVCAHAAWRTTPDTAVDVVMRCVHRARTPEPIRRARRAARLARAAARGRGARALDTGTGRCSH